MMSQTVAELLVGALEQLGVKHIFGLIGDSLNPLADAVRRSDIEWIGVRHEEGAALAAARRRQRPLAGADYGRPRRGGGAPICSPACMKQAATMLRFWRCPATCH